MRPENCRKIDPMDEYWRVIKHQVANPIVPVRETDHNHKRPARKNHEPPANWPGTRML